MKIAISSEGDNLKSMVSSVGARAPYYLIFEENKLVKTIKNPFQSGGGGAGFAVVQMLFDEGVELLYIGKIGDNMKSSLSEKNIDYKIINDQSVQQILDSI